VLRSRQPREAQRDTFDGSPAVLSSEAKWSLS
jgi:hypothetical protein